MIPENALEEMTKNMDPNLVIVEGKEGVQMKWVSRRWVIQGSTENNTRLCRVVGLKVRNVFL